MNKLHYSPEALRDLDEIFSELENPSAAENIINTILEAVDKLQDFSMLGSLLSSVTELESDYRFLVCGNYLVFYRVVGSNVYIDRVLYGRRDYLRSLFNKNME